MTLQAGETIQVLGAHAQKIGMMVIKVVGTKSGFQDKLVAINGNKLYRNRDEEKEVPEP